MPIAGISPLQDAYKFLYPEEGPGGIQREVWQNPITGEYQYRNESSIPLTAPLTESLGVPEETQGYGPEFEPVFPTYDPVAAQARASQQPSLLDRFLPGITQVPEALGTSIATFAEPFVEARRPFEQAPTPYEELGPISRFQRDIQDFAPIIGTAPAAAEALLGAGLSNFARGALISGGRAFQAVADAIPQPAIRLAREEAGGIRLPKFGTMGAKPEEVWLHGTPKSFDPAEIKPAFHPILGGEDYPVFITQTKELAKGFSAGIGEVVPKSQRRVLRYSISPEANVLDLRSLGGEDFYREVDKMTVQGVFSSAKVRQLGYDVVHLNADETIVANPTVLRSLMPTSNILKDESAFLRLGKRTNVSGGITEVVEKAPTLRWEDQMRWAKETFIERTAGLQDAARRVSSDTVQSLLDDYNQIGSVVSVASERARIVLEGVIDTGIKRGIKDIPLYQDDIKKFLVAQDAVNFKRIHPQAHGRAFGEFADVNSARAWLQGLNGNVKYSTDVREGAKVVAKFYSDMRDELYRSGAFTKSEYEFLKREYPWYNPINYVNVASEVTLGRGTPQRLIQAKKSIRAFASDAPGFAESIDPFEQILHTAISNQRFTANQDYLTSVVGVLRRDPALRGQVRKANNITDTFNTQTEDAFHVMKNGKMEKWIAPKWVSAELKNAIGLPELDAITRLWDKANNLWRFGVIEQNPSFVAANFLVDTVNAYVRAGTVPFGAVGEMHRYLKSELADPVLRTFRLAGGEQVRFLRRAGAEDKQRLFNSIVGEVQRAKGLKDPESIGNHLLKILPDIGRATEQGQRLKVFTSKLDKSLPGWRKMNPLEVASTPQARRAASEGLESIINYHRGGWLTRNLNRIIPFANVAMQGALLPIRAAQTPQGALRLASFGTAYTSLAWYNNSYPENADVPAYIRYGSMYLMLPNELLPEGERYDIRGNPRPNYIVLIPALREFTTLFSPISYAIEKFKAQSPTAGYEIMAQMLDNSPAGVGPGFVPELGAILGANENLFRGQKVVPEAEQVRPPQLQYGVSTPRTYRELGAIGGASPRTLQALVETAGTAPVKHLTSITDWILDTFFPEYEEPQVQAALETVQGLPPEQREQVLTLFPRELREAVELAALKRTSATEFGGTLPEQALQAAGGLVGAAVKPIASRFRPQRGGELERVLPRSDEARQADMVQALGVEAVRVITSRPDEGGLKMGIPVMNAHVSNEGKFTRLSDEQLEDAHNTFRDILSVQLAPMLVDPDFQSLPFLVRQKEVERITSKLEEVIKQAVLTPSQRILLGIK